MSLRLFIFALAASFGLPWLTMVVIPHFKMRDLAPIALDAAKDGGPGIFFPKRGGRIVDGARVYAENGCYLCHTQLVRPSYAGNDLYHADWAGLKADPDRGDTRRETNPYDYDGESFAQIGVMRLGPDLSNLARRLESSEASGADPAAVLYAHLYNPRLNPRLRYSACPPHPFLFEKREIKGTRSSEALAVDAGPDYEWIPGPDAKALISYLLSLKKDQKPPAALDFSPKPSGETP
jgi:cytochrome c oxidase cbb3-type subunit 2